MHHIMLTHSQVVVVHTFDPSTLKAEEIISLWVRGQPAPQSKLQDSHATQRNAVSKNKTNKTYNTYPHNISTYTHISHAYIYVYMYIHIYIYIHTYIHTYIYVVENRYLCFALILNKILSVSPIGIMLATGLFFVFVFVFVFVFCFSRQGFSV
jgi:hypothetical protein